MKTILLLFVSAAIARGQFCVGIGCGSGGGGGGGPISTSQLTDFQVAKSGSTLVGAATCTASTPCPLPIGGGIKMTSGAFTVGAPTGAGTMYIYATSASTYIIGLPPSGLTVASCVNCTATTGITQFPANGTAWPIYKWVVNSSAYAATGDDWRIFWGMPWRTNTQGAGISISETLADVSYAASSGGGYTPIFRPIASQDSDHSGCSGPAGGWTIRSTGSFDRPGSFTDDPCTLIMNSTGSTVEYYYYWDGTTVLSAIVRWLAHSGTPAAVEWKGSVACPAAMNSSSFSTATAVTTTATTLDQYNTTTILLPMGSCPAVAGFITIKITNTAAGSGGTVYTGNPEFVGMAL